MKYKTTVYRVLTQSIEIEIEAPWRFSPSRVKMTAEDMAAEESDHDWRDEGWEFDDLSFQAVLVEEE
jgi:hypothetical protein